MAARRQEALAPRAPGAIGPRSIFEEFDRIFNQFRTGLEDFFLLPRLGAGFREEARMALVDVRDTGKEIVVQADLPGVSKEDLEINVTEDTLEIKAQRRREVQEEGQGYAYQERTHNAWYRSLTLPAEVLPDKAEAELKDGVLTLRLPRKEPLPERKVRKVRVK